MFLFSRNAFKMCLHCMAATKIDNKSIRRQHAMIHDAIKQSSNHTENAENAFVTCNEWWHHESKNSVDNNCFISPSICTRWITSGEIP